MIISTAKNTGRKTVTLTSVGLIMPIKDKDHLLFLNTNSAISFPVELAESKSCQVWDVAKEIAQDLAQQGLSGTVYVRGYFQDAIGNEYRSKKVKFNIDKQLEVQ
jgi:hypothetical protein